MRKSKKNLTNKEIERVFLKHPSPSGIVAVYMYRKKERNIVNVMRRQERLHQEIVSSNKNGKHSLNEDIPEGDVNEENGDDAQSIPETEDMQEAANHTIDTFSENEHEMKSHIHDKRSPQNEGDGKEDNSTDS